jgi:hypothetical protein
MTVIRKTLFMLAFAVGAHSNEDSIALNADDECVGLSKEHCSLNALQRSAAAWRYLDPKLPDRSEFDHLLHPSKADEEKEAAQPTQAPDAAEKPDDDEQASSTSGDSTTKDDESSGPADAAPLKQVESISVPTQTKAPAAVPAACKDAVKGDECWKAVHWAKTQGIQQHPQWYVGLTKSSSVADFQAKLHSTKPDVCSLPCSKTASATR